MEFQKRTKDVSQVFDSQWNINHNYQERKEFHNARKEHFNRMFQIQERGERREEILRANSVEGRVQNLNEKMRSADANERLARRNDFKNNFR